MQLHSLIDGSALPVQVRQGLKAVLMGAVAFSVWAIFQPPHAMWIVLGLVVVMLRATIGGSASAALSQVAGAGAGALAGSLILVATGGAFWAAILISLGFFFMTAWQKRIRPMWYAMGFSVFLVVLLGAAEKADPWSLGLWRTINVVIGVAIAFGVTALVWPDRAREELRCTLACFFEQAAGHVGWTVDAYLQPSAPVDPSAAPQLRPILEAARTLATDAVHERGHEPRTLEAEADVVVISMRVLDTSTALDALLEADRRPGPQHSMSQDLKDAVGALQGALTDLGASLREGRPPDHEPDLDASATRLLAAARALPQDEVRAGADVEQVMNLAAFVYALRSLSTTIDECRARLRMPGAAG